MPTTQIHGNKQIQNLTILDANIANAAGILTTKLAEGADFIKRTGTVPFTADQSMGSHYLTNLLDPVNPQDAATRAWVLANSASAVTSSQTARAASTGNLTLTGAATVDGVVLATGNVVLAKNQTTTSQNGLWTVNTSGAWTRTPGMDTWAEVPGTIVSVQEGTANADTIWLSTADAGGTLGTTAINFVQIPGPSDIQAGAGLTRTGQSLDVVAADSSLTVNADSMQVHVHPSGCIIVQSANGIGVNFNSDNLLSLSNVLNVKLDGAGAISAPVAGAGLKINYDTGTLQILGNTLGVKANLYIAASNYIIRETPSGTIDGSNVTFVLASAPNPANTEAVFLNGILQEPGGGNDYTISGATITMASAPPTGSRIKVNYINRSVAPT